jgi:integrase/recombinase XerD
VDGRRTGVISRDDSLSLAIHRPVSPVVRCPAVVLRRGAAGRHRRLSHHVWPPGLVPPAEAIQGPRVYAHASLPAGPPWHTVQSLLATLDTDQPGDIRDRAILMLFALYGFRVREVAQLCLDHLDWDQDVLWVPRPKTRHTAPYPLLPVVGQAIIRYLRTVRPPSPHRALFLTLTPPFRPMSGSALHGLTSKRLQALGVQTVHHGPHALRHACAIHLVAAGFSLKEIGDHLGRRSTEATRVYAKVDLAGLRAVAAMDVGGLV